jgi:flagellin-like hook-associated protein FlgL
MSSHEERFALTAQAYSDAWSARKADRKVCNGDATRLKAVNANLDGLHTEMLRAANAWLAETGPDVEAAFKAAQDAKDAVDRARQDAVDIVTRLGAFADLLNSVTTLIDKARKATEDA